MKIVVNVKTSARKNVVEKIDENMLRVFVTASPIEGKANRAVTKLLAEYFDVPKSRVEIKSGHSSSRKTIIVDDNQS